MWKSTLEVVLDRSGPQETRLALSKTDPEITRQKYIEYVGKASRSVKFVTGEANSKLFNQPTLQETLRAMLSHSNESTVEFVCHKSDNVDEAERLFRVENEGLLALKREFSKRMHIYWSPIRPRQHYAVLDGGKFVILEEPSHKKFAEFWAAVVLDSVRGQKWATRFDEYIKDCTELKFESSDQLAT